MAPTIPKPSGASSTDPRGQYDLVIGSRARGKRAPGSIAWHQLAAGRMAGWGMQLLYGVRYTDMCAFRAIRRDSLLALGMREPTYGWNLEMQMRAARAGLRILEIPVTIAGAAAANRKWRAASPAACAPVRASLQLSGGLQRRPASAPNPKFAHRDTSQRRSHLTGP